jgi:MFS family permease
MLARVIRLWPQGGLWRHADFLKLWTSQSISEVGSQISLLALPLTAVVVLHASAFEVAALSTIEFLPFILFTLPAGVLVDRLPRRAILIVGDAGRALLLGTIPFVHAFGGLTIWQLYAVGFVVGILTVFFDVAYQSYLPSLVERDRLVEGNSKLQVSSSAAQIVGPGLAGALIGVLTAPDAIVVDSLTFVASVCFLFAIRKRERFKRAAAEDERPRMKDEMLEGLRWVFGNSYLRAQAACTGSGNFFSSLIFAILIVYAVRRLHLSAGEIGLVFSLGNAGFLVGALTANRIGRALGVGRTTLLGSLLFGPGMILIPLAPRAHPLPFLIGAQVLTSFGSVVYNITQVSFRQTITPERLQGRMNSVMRLLVWGTMPLGSLLGGALASTIGLHDAIWVGSIGACFSFVPIVLSPIITLKEMPQPVEEPLATAAAMEVPPSTVPVGDA